MSTGYEEYDAFWADTEPEFGTGPLPDGKYSAVVRECKMGQWPDGTARVEWTFAVVGGEFDGRATFMNDSFDENKRGKTKGHFEAFGFKGLPFSQIAARMGELTGRACEVDVKTYENKNTGTSRQYTFLSAVTDAPAPVAAPAPVFAPAPAPAPVTASAEIPF